MKKDNAEIEQYRVRRGLYASATRDGNNGKFLVRYGNKKFQVIASDEMGWEHVSVSLSNRCPTWDEMCFIKDLFWEKDEWAAQFHPSEDAYVNNHPYCLHLWKPTDELMPQPLRLMVGV